MLCTFVTVLNNSMESFWQEIKGSFTPDAVGCVFKHCIKAYARKLNVFE